MRSLMMEQPLLVSALLQHAERHHGGQQIVSRRVEGDVHRYSFTEMARRARSLANALRAHGLSGGDRVGTLAWNGYRHLELHFAVSGTGAVLHTLNPRLPLEQLAHMLQHADDRVLCFDLSFLPIVEALASHLRDRQLLALCDQALMPSSPAGLEFSCYEELIAVHSDAFDWPLIDENDACSLCYTSGTTGLPRGVLYSHRSTVLHSYAAALPDAFGCAARDVIMPVVPMYHVNAWGLPYVACMVGAKLVLPGPALDGKSLYELIRAEGVTLAAGVPTVWATLLEHTRAFSGCLPSLTRAIIGGAACPPAILEELEMRHGVTTIHAWGMTELSPLGTVCTPKCHPLALAPAERLALQLKQGRPQFGMDMKIIDPEGHELPWDGRISGELLVRGHWVTGGYLREHESPLRDGWFVTGDIATIDHNGFMQICDRSKDLIKSGGEWISSVELERIASLHPAVSAAACIAARHPKWNERPVLLVVKKSAAVVSESELLAFYSGRVAGWWIPDAVLFVDVLPLGATGKVLKRHLREKYGDVLLAAAASQ